MYGHLLFSHTGHPVSLKQSDPQTHSCFKSAQHPLPEVSASSRADLPVWFRRVWSFRERAAGPSGASVSVTCALQTQASIQTAGALKQARSWKRGKQFVKLWVPADDSPGVSPACGYLVTLSSCAENSQHATGELPPSGFGCGESLKLEKMEGEKQPCRFFLTFVSADFFVR